ncbi:alpha-amylase family glycosyl hydrolase [Chlamydiifrater volucris]|uniref:alpha-amylase family glycosyl hydrolase n=1 Tax=Chlamydiifrater volucris TaxID=2681470 RepID=UPI0032B2BB6B
MFFLCCFVIRIQMNTFFYDPKNPPLGCKKIGYEHFSFCVPSTSASQIHLVLSDHQGTILKEVPLNLLNTEKKLWHVEVDAIPENCLYGFRLTTNKNSAHEVISTYVADPYSTTLSTPEIFTETPKRYHYTFSHLPTEEYFNWENDTPPAIPSNETIIYEVHVRSFTNHDSSRTSSPGTFSGFAEKIPHLIELGVTTVELLPIFEFNERDHPFYTLSDNRLCNYWGYAPVNFFCPSRRYSKYSESPSYAFKDFVKKLHKAGLEVILDVVFNHTGSEALTPFSTLDKVEYYITDPLGQHTNYSGCGNTFNSNSNLSIHLIINSLRYWINEFHVDGFRFDLASCLLRSTSGELVKNSPILDRISKDPIISKVKLIAEPWDAAGAYHLGFFSSTFERWSEWNGEYRDSVRAFLNGDKNAKERFATSFTGSPNIFKSPYNSINFVTCHDGFSLRDLVTYNEKHNADNGENNQDGSSANYSHNFGIEGPTDDIEIQVIRNRQIKNFMLTLMLSQGIPMILSGDEYGHSGNGNNNRWCHDSTLNYFLWSALEKSTELLDFMKKIISLRKDLRELFMEEVPKKFIWTEEDGQPANFTNPGLFLAVTIPLPDYCVTLAFNSSKEKKLFKIPEAEHKFPRLIKILDTEHGFFENRDTTLKTKEQTLSPHTIAVYKSVRESGM